MSLIALLVRDLGLLLSTLRMLNALDVIALAMVFGGCAMQLRGGFVKFGGFIVIAIRHVWFLRFSPRRAPTRAITGRSSMSREGVVGTGTASDSVGYRRLLDATLNPAV